MPNQYTSLTQANIQRKINRKTNPVQSVVALADEFGVDTTYLRSDGTYGSAAPRSFRNKVKALIGESGYRQLRDSSRVNLSYR